MPAVQETVDRVRAIDVDQYKWGFSTSIESGEGPERPFRGGHPVHFRQEG